MKKPLIGVSTTIMDDSKYTLNRLNVESIEKAGGIAVLLPSTDNEDLIEQYGELLDGLLLSGGDDVDPMYFGEEPHQKMRDITPARDRFELAMARLFFMKNKPVLGICRGAQVMNVAAGGNLYQDIYSQIGESVMQHGQKLLGKYHSQTAELLEGSVLSEIYEKTHLRINSFHHQAVKDVGEGFVASAHTSDGVIEAIESRKYTFAVGVQWHPELLIHSDNDESLQIFERFITSCSK